ncbi:uncharacterized protein PODANS_7_7240 [Podospora anserina S mat+]|uniref:Podospora anserina S mat+ genomic DNA chromosome 7, supercontig 1 n=1 Tax=Podospora anserina (strain S / ATCC MYA-4624 / DSM 980 / FGSC 10383) TaxID=515849 RepID=B2AWI1_PODAN|nr:uncharacterized protein PODANS_7_7240 [Podospora anserina S mat+]CAP68755.1 unnamed protein product [Podospora anserina S mat+]
MESPPSKEGKPPTIYTSEDTYFESLHTLGKEDFRSSMRGSNVPSNCLRMPKQLFKVSRTCPRSATGSKILTASNKKLAHSVCACTAAITEVSYNTSDDPKKYRAEVEFITADEWAKELDILLDDIHNGQATFGPEVFGTESEAGIAYHKLRAVYPALKGDDIKKGKFNVDTLVKDDSVKHLFGSVKTVACPSSNGFVKLLRTFVHSKEKGRGRPKEATSLEFWPLIKVVRVFIRSETLKSGLVLVDLDSNAARSRIANRYIQRCSGLWVVTPITRAVDDLAARQLLGKAFKRQLRFDGAYSAVTVICSKTDDISETELLKSLPDHAEAHRYNEKLKVMRAEVLERSGDLMSKKQQLAQVREDIKLLNNQSLRLKLTLLENPSDGMIVLELPQASRKRPARPAADEARKRFRKQQQDQSPEASDLSDDAEPLFEEGEPRQVKSMNEVIDLLKKQRRSACICFRNDFSKPELQRQFGEGVLDKVQQDKYYEIVKKLPVFCVSSNAYHKLMGRLQEGESIHGFTTTDDTQIPMLKEHALNIVAQIECENYRQVLRDFARFLTGLHLRVLVAAKHYTLAEDIREVEKAILQDRLNELQQRFDSMIEEAFNNLDQAVHSNIFCKLPNARDTASKSAITAIERWFSRPRNGGLLYGTFRAACVRDFISPGWEKVFPDLVTKHLVPLADGMIMELRAFSNLTAEREVLNKLPVFFAVRHQMTLLEGILQDVPKLSKRLNDTQKSASRMIVSTIRENMIPAYQACKEEKGMLPCSGALAWS